MKECHRCGAIVESAVDLCSVCAISGVFEEINPGVDKILRFEQVFANKMDFEVVIDSLIVLQTTFGPSEMVNKIITQFQAVYEERRLEAGELRFRLFFLNMLFVDLEEFFSVAKDNVLGKLLIRNLLSFCDDLGRAIHAKPIN